MAEFLTTKQLAERWGMSPGTLANWRARNTGPRYIRLGGKRGQVVYRLADVQDYEQKHTIHTGDNDDRANERVSISN